MVPVVNRLWCISPQCIDIIILIVFASNRNGSTLLYFMQLHALHKWLIFEKGNFRTLTLARPSNVHTCLCNRTLLQLALIILMETSINIYSIDLSNVIQSNSTIKDIPRRDLICFLIPHYRFCKSTHYNYTYCPF